MRAKLLSLLILAAVATAGAAPAQQAATDDAPPPIYIEGGPERYLTALARIQEAASPARVTPRPVFVVIGHNLVSGQLGPGERLMALVDARQPTFSCAPSQRGVEIMLACSNGSGAKLKLGPSGCGRSLSGEAASMCIGLNPRNAVRRLTVPAGKTLRIDGERLVLEPLAGD